MKYRNIVIIVMIITLNLLNSQSISEYKELFDLYKKSQNINLGKTSFGEQSTNIKSNNYDLSSGINSLRKLSSKQAISGHWKSKEEYKNWLDETYGDVNAMKLYGFVEDSLPYFGYDFFSQQDTIPFLPNTLSPENYILGPGDKIEISLWGRAQLHELYTINRDGNIYINSIGIIYLNSKTLKEARLFLKNKFSDKISSLHGENPTSFINITLGELKSINVHFIGNVKIPGVYLVHPLSTVITGLFQAGGIDTTGSLRKIQIHRNGSLYKEIDLYHYLVNGDISVDILLQNNDIIVVPTRLSTVTIEGEVFRSSKYEALENENLANIVEYAGGFKPNAANQIILKRIVPLEKRITFDEPVKYKTIDFNQLNNIISQDGDVLTINAIPAIINEVTISGQIKNPGSYVLTESMTIKDILIRAGGIEDKNYLKSAYLDKIEIVRVDENSANDIVIEFDYHDIISTNKYENFKLQNDDQIIVRKNIYYQKDNYIKIDGEVLVPGLFPLKETEKSLQDIIQKAGGFTNRAFIDGIQITRNGKKLVWKNFSIPLIKGDNIFVPQRPGIIEVKGEVYNPGLIHFTKGQSVMSYIRSAGGLTSDAKRFNITLMYPNGNVKTKKIFPRKVTEGCIITAHRKSEKSPFDILTIIKETTAIASSVALTYIAIKSIQ